MARWAFVVDIYERQPYPVLRHVFYGQTKEEAKGYFESHLKIDAFLRDCVRRGRWTTVKCRAETYWMRL